MIFLYKTCTLHVCLIGNKREYILNVIINKRKNNAVLSRTMKAEALI